MGGNVAWQTSSSVVGARCRQRFTYGSAEILEAALGAERVLTLEEGFAGAVGAALVTPHAKEADYVLLMHDDTMLAPGCDLPCSPPPSGSTGSGWWGPTGRQEDVLRDIGRSADRFGYPYSPLEEGEIDQGQYDRVREVLSVSRGHVLVAREPGRRWGPDERLVGDSEDGLLLAGPPGLVLALMTPLRPATLGPLSGANGTAPANGRPEAGTNGSGPPWPACSRTTGCELL